MLDLEIIKEFGFPVAMVFIMVFGFSWLGRIMVTHFIDTIKTQIDERKQMNQAFLDMLSDFKNQINENTNVLIKIHQKLFDHG